MDIGYGHKLFLNSVTTVFMTMVSYKYLHIGINNSFCYYAFYEY